jgi:hypothetical protein
MEFTDSKQSVIEVISLLDGIKSDLVSGLWYLDQLSGTDNVAEAMLIKNVKMRSENLKNLTEEFQEIFMNKWDESQED